jgi:hypothetical protein
MRSQTTHTGVPDEEKEVQELELQVVHHAMGRPLFLTSRRFVRICRHIELGESISESCRLELVCYRSFRLHVSRNAKYQRRLKQAEETREEFLREYHIANVRKHAPRNVLASLWWLERRFPNQFALKPVHRSEGSSAQPIGDKIDESQLRRYAELMAEFKRENEAKTPELPAPETAGEPVS